MKKFRVTATIVYELYGRDAETIKQEIKRWWNFGSYSRVVDVKVEEI